MIDQHHGFADHDREMEFRTPVSRSSWAVVIAGVVSALLLGQPGANGVVGARTVSDQAPAPTAATVPPERTIPRPTSAPKKKVVRRSTVVKKKATTSKTATTTKRTGTTTVATGGAATPSIRATINSGGALVALRTEPDSHSTLMRRIPDGTTIAIRCQTLAVSVTDLSLGRSSSVWNELTTGGYVTNMYTSLYKAGETAPHVGVSVCGAAKSSGGEASTSTIGVGGTEKVPAKPVVTSVS